MKNKMKLKILIYTGHLGIGGTQRQIFNLVKGLSKLGHETHVLTTYATGHFWDELHKEHSNLHSLYSRKPNLLLTATQLVLAPYKLKKFLDNQHFDVLYSFLYRTNITAFYALLQNKSRTKLVWGIRSTTSVFNIKKLFSELFSPWLSSHVDLVITNSIRGRKYLIQKGYDRSKIKCIQNGIDTNLFNIGPRENFFREKYKIEKTTTLIGLIGRLDFDKDHLTFFKAAKLAQENNENLRFVYVGNGPKKIRQSLFSLTKKLGIEDKTIFIEEYHNMPELYQALDICCSTSVGESFQNTIAEAMACGIPCIVTDVGDAKHIVGNFGIVVPPKDPEAFSSAILDLSTNLKTIDRTQIRESIVQRFGLEKMVLETETTLLDLFI